MTTATTLSTSDLERVYDALAEGIDRAPAGRSEQFLVKLALLQARELGDRDRTLTLIDTALRDL